MPNIRQILTDWTAPAGGGEVSVMYFHADSAVADQRAALASFWTDVQGALTSTTSWRIRDDGVELDEATGTLTGAWGSAVVYSDSGDQATQPVADASQALLRWNTTTVINGRFLKGRTYVPGVAAANLVGGNLSAGMQAAYAGFIGDFLDALVGFSVWHRPKGVDPGQAISVTSGSLWEEMAVLRRRRK